MIRSVFDKKKKKGKRDRGERGRGLVLFNSHYVISVWKVQIHFHATLTDVHLNK